MDEKHAGIAAGHTGDEVCLPFPAGGLLREQLLVEEAGALRGQPLDQVRDDQAEEAGEDMQA